VTRERIYIETMQQILSSTNKIMMDYRGAGTCCTCRSTRSCSRAPRRAPPRRGGAAAARRRARTGPALARHAA